MSNGEARVRRVPVLVAATLVGVLGSACSGSGPDSSRRSDPSASSGSPAPSASSSGSPTDPPSGSPVAQPPPTAPAARQGRVGQRAFARHVMDLWGYALRTDNGRPLTALSAGRGPCDGCDLLNRSLARRRGQGWSVDFTGLDVRRITLRRKGGDVLARALVDVPESDSYYSDGSYRNTNAAHEGARFDVRMHWTRNGYRLVSFTVG